MESAGHNKKDTPTPPKFTMRTRRQIAEEKRKAEEEIQMVKEAKKRKEMYEPRENEDVKPQDIILDPKLLKIYVGHVETEKEVKVEVVLEDSEDEDVNLEGCDGGVHQVLYQEGEEIEEEELDAGNQQEDVRDEEKGIQVEEKGVLVEEKGVQVEDMGVRTEEMSVQTEEQAVEVEHKNVEEHLTLDKVFSNVLPLLNQKDVFRCRLVNKQWRRKVDEFLEDSLVPQHYDDEAYLKKVKSSPSQLCPLPKFRIVKYAYQFTSERSLEIFNEHMATHMHSGFNPFVGGATVTLKNSFPASCRLSRATKQFMEKFGVHIRRLVIQQGGMYLELYADFDIIGFVDCVKQCLHHVPNLERLKIVGNGLKSYEKDQLTDLRLKLYRFKFLDRMPKLDKLDKLEFKYLDLDLKLDDPTAEDWEPFPYFPYMEEIFNYVMIKPYYQTQLKNLSLDWPNKLLNFKLCNVRELSLTSLQCDLMETKFQLPVEKLTLSFPFENYNPLGIFKKFPHLRHLSIDINMLAACVLEPNLPENNIHTLKIMIFKDLYYVPENLNFVFPKLRNLILRLSKFQHQYKRDMDSDVNSLLDQQKYDKDVENGKISIAHMICGGSSYDSSLWNFLPQLEILALSIKNRDSYTLNNKGTKEDYPFKCIVETREGYQRYRNRVSRLMKQCFAEKSAVGNDLETSEQSQSNFSRSQVAEMENSNKKKIALKSDGIKEPHGLTFILPLLGRKDIFQCRLVNKQWRGMVDDFIGTIIVPQQYDDKLYLEKTKNSPTQLCPLPNFRNVEYAYNFRSERMLELFNERMGADLVDLGLSPFVGHATVILDNLFLESPYPLLTPALKEFLDKFGVLIRNLVIKQTSRGFDVVRFVEFVKLCLHYVPALERLKLVMDPPIECEQSETDKIQWNNSGNDLLTRVPKLPNLCTCELDFSYKCSNLRLSTQKVPYMDQVFLEMMIKPFYQSQLKNLQIRGTLAENLSLKCVI